MGGPSINNVVRLGGARVLSSAQAHSQSSSVTVEADVDGVAEADAIVAAGVPVPQPTINRFGDRAQVTEALTTALSSRIPPELASAHIDREGFALIQDAPPPFTSAEIDELLRLLDKLHPPQYSFGIASFNPDWLKNCSGDEKEKFAGYLRKMESYGALLLQKAGLLTRYPSFNVRYTDGSSSIYLPSFLEDDAGEWHEDGGDATISIAFKGSGTMVLFGERFFTVPTGIPLVITGSEGAKKKSVRATTHKAPPFKRGEERLLLLIRVGH